MEFDRVLVIGAAGFVGGHLIAQFGDLEKVEVHAAKMPAESIEPALASRCTVHDVDITVRSSVDSLLSVVRPTRIVHLAAQSSVALSWKEPVLTMAVNVNGVLNVLESVRETVPGSRVLLVGSSEQYGRVQPQRLPVDEACTLSPDSPYAISKSVQESLARLYVGVHGMDIVLVRAFNHIGPGQSPIFVVSDFAHQIAEIEKGLRDPVIRVGNLSARRDFTDVRDIVRGYNLLLEKGRSGEVYNIGQGRSVEIGKILDAMIRESHVPVRVEIEPSRFRPVDVPDIYSDVSKIGREIGWSPRIDIAVSLHDTLDYWRAHV
jgi:GDP-4-dehydro-6-deoxy-D-mannose reductase